MTLEFEVGSTITINDGSRAVCEEAGDTPCNDCVLVNSKLCGYFLCFYQGRKDGKNVHFRKLEEGGKA